MEVTDQLLDKLANLSKLHFSDAEKALLKSDLQKMIEFVNRLSTLDTSGVEPLLHMNSSQTVLRSDEAADGCTTEAALQNAAVHNGQFFLVPKVIRNPE